MTGKAKKLLLIAAMALVILTQHLLALDSGFKVLEMNSEHVVIEYTVKFNGFDEIKSTDGKAYYLPKIADAKVEYTTPGLPSSITTFVNVLVPSVSDFTISEVVPQNIKHFNKPIAPSPYMQKSDEGPTFAYKMNWQETANAPVTPWVSLEEAGLARNLPVAKFRVNAALYDAQNGTIDIPEKILFTIKFNKKATGFAKNTNFDPNTAAIAINPSQAGLFAQTEKQGDKLLSEDYSNISSGTWLKIKVTDEGIYKVDGSALSAIGINIPANQVSTLKVFGKGGLQLPELVSDGKNNELDEQPVIVKTNGDGSLASVIFYGASTKGFHYDENGIEHYKNIYSDNNYYLLTWGGRDGKRAVAGDYPQGNVDVRPAIYTERIYFEEESVSPYDYGGGRQWMGRSYFGSAFTNSLDNLDRSGEIFYRIGVAHKPHADTYGYMTVNESGNKLGVITLKTTGDEYAVLDRRFATYTLDASKIASDNRSVLSFSYSNSSDPNNLAYFDFYEIHYPRIFKAIQNSIGFISDTLWKGNAEFNIDGFSGNEIIGYDVTDVAHPILLKNKSVTGGIFSFISAMDTSNPRRFYISSQFKTPSIEKTTFANLRSTNYNVDAVVITHPDLYESAVKYKEYRQQKDGISIEVVKTSDIYNEFDAGLPDLTAIRDYMIWAYNHWSVKPKYLVLWGDGHFDFKNISSQKTNYIPAYQSPDDVQGLISETGISFVTDDYYAQISGDDPIPDLGFGRLTIDNPEVGFNVLDKIKHYENQSSTDDWRADAIFVADDGPADLKNGSYDGNTHTTTSENVQKNSLPDIFQYDKIYLVEYPVENVPGGRRKPLVTSDILNKVNSSGALLMNYVGHGNPRVWAHENVFNRDVNTQQMLNYDKLFFLSAATCDFGRFDMTDTRSGSEELFVSKFGGAIGVVSAARVVYTNWNEALNLLLINLIFTRDSITGTYPKLGDVIYRLKSKLSGTNDKKYFLLGDPLMKLLIPDYRVKINTINGTELNDSTIVNIKGLDKIVVTGSILTPDGKNAASDFNGDVILTTRDGDENIVKPEEFENLSSKHYFTKLGGILNKSSYEVTNGQFTAEFTLPKDISFSDNNGRIFGYAHSDDNRYGAGETDRLRVDGIANVSDQDTTGPEIQLYLDARSFVPGDYVRSNPILLVDLYDKSGINSTGLGIGHRLEAWIDDNPESLDLTSNYSTSISDNRRGSASKQLTELSKGLHKVKVRAWDIFNNYSVAETYFNVGDSNRLGITDAMAYPNPFGNLTNIKFKYNIDPPFDVQIKIYNSLGVCIKTISKTVTDVFSTNVVWDATNDGGVKQAQGAYYFNIIYNPASGNSILASGLMNYLIGN